MILYYIEKRSKFTFVVIRIFINWNAFNCKTQKPNLIQDENLWLHITRQFKNNFHSVNTESRICVIKKLLFSTSCHCFPFCWLYSQENSLDIYSNSRKKRATSSQTSSKFHGINSDEILLGVYKFF